MSPETQVRLFFSGLAVVLFVLASWIFWTDGDVPRGLAWLGLGLAAVAVRLMVPPTAR